MSETITLAPDPHPTAIGTLFCTGCGYCLAGTASDGTCPECGRAVADSVRDCGDRDAVEGALREEVLIAIAPSAAVTVIAFLSAFVGGTPPRVLLGIVLLNLLAVLFGAWQVWRRAKFPGLVQTPHRIGLAIAAACYVAVWLPFFLAHLLPWELRLLQRLPTLALGVWIVWLGCAHLADIARRLELPVEARRFRVLGVLIAAITGIIGLASTANAFAVHRLGFNVVSVILLIWMALLIWSLRLTRRFVRSGTARFVERHARQAPSTMATTTEAAV